MYDRNDRGNRRAQRSEAKQPAEETEGQLEGRNAIAEALKAGGPLTNSSSPPAIRTRICSVWPLRQRRPVPSLYL